MIDRPLNLQAVDGWVLSILESYVFLNGFNFKGGARAFRWFAVGQLKFFIDQQVRRFKDESSLGKVLSSMQ